MLYSNNCISLDILFIFATFYVFVGIDKSEWSPSVLRNDKVVTDDCDPARLVPGAATKPLDKFLSFLHR